MFSPSDIASSLYIFAKAELKSKAMEVFGDSGAADGASGVGLAMVRVAATSVSERTGVPSFTVRLVTLEHDGHFKEDTPFSDLMSPS